MDTSQNQLVITDEHHVIAQRSCTCCRSFQGSLLYVDKESSAGFCSQCAPLGVVAPLIGVDIHSINRVLLLQWRSIIGRAQIAAAERYEEAVSLQLESLAVQTSTLQTLLIEFGLRQDAAKEFDDHTFLQSIKCLSEALRQRHLFLNAWQAQHIAAPAVGKSPSFIQSVIHALHPYVLQQYDWWLDDGYNGCLYTLIERHPAHDLQHTRIALPCTFVLRVPDGCQLSGHDETESQSKRFTVDIPVRVRNLDPCDFCSVIQLRKDARARFLAFAMGLHSRLGATSAVRKLARAPDVVAHVASFLKDDEVFSKVKWLTW